MESGEVSERYARLILDVIVRLAEASGPKAIAGICLTFQERLEPILEEGPTQPQAVLLAIELGRRAREALARYDSDMSAAQDRLVQSTLDRLDRTQP